MNSKRIGVSFLLLVLMHFLVVCGIAVYYRVSPAGKEIGIVENLLISQLVHVIPVTVMILTGREKFRQENVFRDVLGFQRIKISTALMTILYTFLLMPLATLANAISMLFVDNTIANLAGDILNVPFFVMFPVMAIVGPFCEEMVFRGAFFRGFRKSGNLFGAILLSGLLFALMHMNFNQAAYALVLGVMMALLAEAAGSSVAPFIMHFIYNGQSVCMMYLQDALFSEFVEEGMEEYRYVPEEMAVVIAVYLLLTAVCTMLAFCVAVWIAGNEGKQNFLQTIWKSRKNHGEKLGSVCLVIGMMLAFIYMILEMALEYIL